MNVIEITAEKKPAQETIRLAAYLQIGDEAYVEHKLKNTLEQHDTLDSFDSELTNKTVKLIKLAENGSVSIILINDQEIRKEQTDHANSNPSDAT